MSNTLTVSIRPEHRSVSVCRCAGGFLLKTGCTQKAPRCTDTHTLAEFAVCAAVVLGIAVQARADEPFKLNAQDSAQQQSYPAPQMVQDQYTAASPVLSGGVHTQVVLPPPFLGAWNVTGQRMKIDALPEFQQAAQTAFSPTTNNVWEITGDPGKGYSLGSNTGIKTQLIVDKVQGNQAYIRYAHPIGNTTAQEAIVMQLGHGGRSFTGLERVSIVKGPKQPPRARVTYQLSGSRQP